MATTTKMAPVAVVDMNRLLDESPQGQAGQATLRARYDAARAAWEKLVSRAERATSSSAAGKGQAAATAFQTEAVTELEAARAALRAEVTAVIQPAIDAERDAHGAVLVLDRAAAVSVAAGADITDAVLARLRQG